MRVLIAEDDPISRHVLETAISGWGHEVIVVGNGEDAWRVFCMPDAPRLAILDWMMPGMDGTEVCSRLRGQSTSEPPYIILLSARDTIADVVAGLHRGANDYIVKPFNRDELGARFHVGCRVVESQHALANRIRELEETAVQIKHLRTLLPICCSCKRIRDEQDCWHQLEEYLLDHSEVRFSHGLCPVCLGREVSELD